MLAGGIWATLAVLAVLAYFATGLPEIDDLESSSRRPGVTVLASDRTILANSGDFYGSPYRVSELPPWLPQAVISIEDHRFYSHHGVDPVGILRAVVRRSPSRLPRTSS